MFRMRGMITNEALLESAPPEMKAQIAAAMAIGEARMQARLAKRPVILASAERVTPSATLPVPAVLPRPPAPVPAPPPAPPAMAERDAALRRLGVSPAAAEAFARQQQADARRSRLHELAKAACAGDREARREVEAVGLSPELLCALRQVFGANPLAK